MKSTYTYCSPLFSIASCNYVSTGAFLETSHCRSSVPPPNKAPVSHSFFSLSKAPTGSGSFSLLPGVLILLPILFLQCNTRRAHDHIFFFFFFFQLLIVFLLLSETSVNLGSSSFFSTCCFPYWSPSSKASRWRARIPYSSSGGIPVLAEIFEIGIILT